MPDVIGEQVATTLEEIRSRAMSWQTLDPEERIRRIRQHLEEKAAAIAVTPREFAERIAAEVPEPEARPDRAATSGASKVVAPPASNLAPPQDPVDQIMDLVTELSAGQHAQLLARMASLGLLPPPILPPAKEEAPRPVSVSRGDSELGDEAFRVLASGLGVAVFDDRFGGEKAAVPLKAIADALDADGIRRQDLTSDRLAIALGALAAAVGAWASENELHPKGLGQTLRLERRQRLMSRPDEQLRMYLAGRGSHEEFGEGVREYFEPYRELSERFTTLVDRLFGLAMKLEPARIERDSGTTRSWPLGDNSKQCWATYMERINELKSKGFGGDPERTRGWLIREWLL